MFSFIDTKQQSDMIRKIDTMVNINYLEILI